MNDFLEDIYSFRKEIDDIFLGWQEILSRPLILSDPSPSLNTCLDESKTQLNLLEESDMTLSSGAQRSMPYIQFRRKGNFTDATTACSTTEQPRSMEPCTTPSTHFKFRSTTSACPILLFLFSFVFFPITTQTEQLPQVSNLRLSISDNLYWKFVWDRPIVDEVLNRCLSYTVMIEHDGNPFAPRELFKEETMAFSSKTNVNITAQVRTRLKDNCTKPMDPNNCTKQMDPNSCIKLMDPSNWTQSAPWPLNEKEVTDFICFWWNEKDFTCTWKARKNRMYNLQFTNRSMSKPLECKPVEKSKCVSTNVSKNDYFACLNTTTLDGTATQASCKSFHYSIAVKYGPVTNITAKEHEDRIHLSWNCPLGLVSCSLDYQIEYSTDKEKSKTEMKNIEESTYYDLMYISPDTCYTFRIRVDSARNVESEWSEPLECCVTKKGNMPISVGVIIGISLTLLISAAMLWFAVFNWRGIKNKLFPNIPKPDKAMKDWLDHRVTSNTESRSLKSNMTSKQVVPECAIIEGAIEAAVNRLYTT
uniref:Fibronectin type-III domain-containing protein n=1 Tax=Eptatretus burgeri TaxID=7764 RepID=A0A8C4QUH0_EPTBU